MKSSDATAFAAALQAGEPPEGPVASHLVERARAPGLAAYVAEAIRHNAERRGD